MRLVYMCRHRYYTSLNYVYMYMYIAAKDATAHCKLIDRCMT